MPQDQVLDYSFLEERQVELYSTKTCPDCSRLSQLLRIRKVEFTKVMVDEDEVALRELEKGAGKRAVPYIRVEGKHWVRGYHAAESGRLSEPLLITELRAALGE